MAGRIMSHKDVYILILGICGYLSHMASGIFHVIRDKDLEMGRSWWIIQGIQSNHKFLKKKFSTFWSERKDDRTKGRRCNSAGFEDGRKGP